MKLDRARFLMLTTAISGAVVACSITSTNNTVPGGGGSDSGGGGDGTTGGDGAVAQDSGGDTSASDGANEAATCDDSIGKPGACVDYADGGTGPDAAAADGGDAGPVCLSALLCDGVLADLKPKVAQTAIACVVALPTCESGAGIDTCIATALAGACPDATGKASCDQIAAVCGDAGADAGVSQADCVKYTAGLTAAGRTKFVACMTESACFVTDALTCLAQL